MGIIEVVYRYVSTEPNHAVRPFTIELIYAENFIHIFFSLYRFRFTSSNQTPTHIDCRKQNDFFIIQNELVMITL